MGAMVLVANAKLITWGQPNQILDDYALLIDDDRIAVIAPQADLIAKNPEHKLIDARGQYVMPGNICAHTHFYGAFARGMTLAGPPPGDFPEILERLWWPLDRSLTHQDVRLSTLAMLVDAIRHGTTTLFDHHASPNAIEGSLDVIAEAVEQAGLRAVLCYEVTDRDGAEKTRAGIKENLRFIQRLKENPYPNLRATFGMHASLTLSDATLEACREAVPQGVGFHIHAAESIADQYDSLAKSGLRVVDRLQRHAILGPHSILAHAVHVDASEINLLAETGSWVTHQPRSNMNNAVGVAQVESMLRRGVPVCLGTDGFTSTMWEEWKTAYLVQKLWHSDPRRMGADKVAELGVYNNAALANSFFGEAPLGVISQGAYADLIFVDYHPFTPVTPENLPWHVVFGFNESMVTTTMVAGKLLMSNGQLLTLDEERIAAQARQQATQVWSRYQGQYKQEPS
jgi:putative selenium metabolism protein SsnA